MEGTGRDARRLDIYICSDFIQPAKGALAELLMWLECTAVQWRFIQLVHVYAIVPQQDIFIQLTTCVITSIIKSCFPSPMQRICECENQ